MYEIKACGTRTVFDLNHAVNAGFNAVGIICHPSRQTRHTVDVDQAVKLSASTPDNVTTVLLPRLRDPEEILAMTEMVQPDRLQLGETEDIRVTQELYESIGRPAIAQVIHVDNEGAIEQADTFMDCVDIIHLDSLGERPGGNGVTHDWSVSREITSRAHAAGLKVLLAGGLTSENVAEAVAMVRPDGVDVESDIKGAYRAHSPRQLKAFEQNARAAFQKLEAVE